jgi:nucleotide-binding universal stress UspA family protein
MIRIQGVLVPIDFSKESLLAAKFAASLAQEYQTTLHVLHVFDPVPSYAANYLPETYHEDVTRQIREDLSRVVPRGVKDRIQVQEILVTGSPTDHVIVEKAKELGVDVIVISTRGRTGMAHVLLGSVAEHVIRHAPCPVFVVRNPKDKYVYGWE